VESRTRSGTRRRKTAIAVLFATLAVVARLALAVVPAAAVGGTYTVDSVGDQNDAVIGNGICRTGVLTCTLRAALAEADADGGPSTINFNIAGAGVHTINLTTQALDFMNEGDTTINGYSQPGSSPNTDPLVSNAVINIEIKGTGSAPDALVIQSPRNTIRGLAFYALKQNIRIADSDASNNVIAGNFLGTDATGTYRQTTRNNATFFGVVVRSASTDNVIGGPNAADRNVISGNGGRSVLIGVPGAELDPGTDRNVVQNNLIGLAPNGLSALPNLGHAIDINNGAAHNVVENNTVSGNGQFSEGIEVSHGTGTTGNEITNNRVGTNPAGTAVLDYTHNGTEGIRVEDGADATVVQDNIVGGNNGGGIQLDSLTHPATNSQVEDNFIGVTSTGVAIPNGAFGIHAGLGEGSSNQAGSTDGLISHNSIAFNPVGVSIEGSASLRNRISENSIHDNTGLGIDLVPFGQVNQNDPGDADTGPNELLNWPVLTSATPVSVSGTACGVCTIEVFQADASATLDGASITSYGEGQTFITSTTSAPDGSFVATLPPSVNSRIVTATATDPSGNTSEFGQNRLVPGSNGAPSAGFKATCPNLQCTFDGSPSTDPDGDAITSYTWNFGDGGSDTGKTPPPHTYAAAGTYRVTLTVQDAQGGTGTTTSSVFVSGDSRLARDGFNRSVGSGWGTAETGGAWTGTGGNGGLSVSGSSGRADVAPATSKEVVLGSVSTQQTDASITVTANRAPVGGDLIAAIEARRQDATVAYRGRLRIASDGTVFAGAEAGSTLLGEAQALTGVTSGTALRLRFRATGTNPTTLEVKVWKADQAEPGAFTFTTTDSTLGLQQAGTVGVRLSSTEVAGSTVQFRVDDVDVVAPK
jgi:PKD repeat protein